MIFFSKNNFNILTTEVIFEGQRFAILAMFFQTTPAVLTRFVPNFVFHVNKPIVLPTSSCFGSLYYRRSLLLVLHAALLSCFPNTIHIISAFLLHNYVPLLLLRCVPLLILLLSPTS